MRKSLFHTGVAKTHVAQDHTKYTSSRRHPFVDDGGLVDKDAQAVTQHHVEKKTHRHNMEDMARPYSGYWKPTHDWNSPGEAPTRKQVKRTSESASA